MRDLTLSIDEIEEKIIKQIMEIYSLETEQAVFKFLLLEFYCSSKKKEEPNFPPLQPPRFKPGRGGFTPELNPEEID